MSSQQQSRTYSDNPQVSETFADGIRSVSFQDGVWRFEFTVSRLQEPKPSSPPPLVLQPSCRLVLSPDAGIALLNQLTQVAALLEQQGTLKRNATPAPTVIAPGSKGPH